ncbi:MAG: exosortase C-terminal domain/associated protein EpsI, partial [Geminicoccaceae bacterium]
AAVMLLFLAIGSWIADWPEERENAEPHSIHVDVSPWRPVFALPLIGLIVAAPAYAKLVLERAPDAVALDPKSALSPKLVQHLAPACKTASDDADDWRPLFKKADFSRGLQLDCGGQPVNLFVAYYVYERDGAELVHHANRLADGDNWTRISASWYTPKIEGLPSSLRKEELTGRAADDRLVLAWYWVDGQLMARGWQVKAYQLYQKLLGKEEPSALIALSAPYSDDQTDALSGIAKVLERHKGISDYLIDLKPKPES